MPSSGPGSTDLNSFILIIILKGIYIYHPSGFILDAPEYSEVKELKGTS